MINDPATSPENRQLTRSTNAPALFAAILLAFLLPALGILWQPPTTAYPDIDYYAQMAMNNSANVPAPFNTRVLAPFLASLLIIWLSIDAMHALLIVNLAALGCLIWLAFIHLRDHAISPPMALLLLCVPYLYTLYQFIYVPDLLTVTVSFAALICLLKRSRLLVAIGLTLTLLAIMSRPTVAAITGIMAVIMFFQHTRSKAALLLLTTIASYLVAAMAVQSDQGNVHELNSTLYMIMKLPVNFVRNYLGIIVATDAFAHYCPAPMMIINVEQLPGTGAIKAVHVCYPDWIHLANIYISLAIMVGIWPWIALRRNLPPIKGPWIDHAWRERLWLAPLIIFLLLAPLLGLTVQRLFLYSFIVYLFALPQIANSIRNKATNTKLPKWPLLLAGISTQAVGVVFLIWLSPPQ